MLENCMNFLLSVSQHKVFKYYGKLLEKSGVTPAQAGILTCVWSQAQITPKEIGQKLYLEAPTVSGILDKMQKLDLITRRTDPENRRVVFVAATAKADALKKDIEQATAQLNEEVLKDFSKEEQEVLRKLLMRTIQTDLVGD